MIFKKIMSFFSLLKGIFNSSQVESHKELEPFVKPPIHHFARCEFMPKMIDGSRKCVCQNDETLKEYIQFRFAEAKFKRIMQKRNSKIGKFLGFICFWRPSLDEQIRDFFANTKK